MIFLLKIGEQSFSFFFVLFFLLNNFGRKFVKQDVVLPLYGMWLATIALLPIGFLLVYKAMHDSQLLNKEYYFRLARKIRFATEFSKK